MSSSSTSSRGARLSWLSSKRRSMPSAKETYVRSLRAFSAANNATVGRTNSAGSRSTSLGTSFGARAASSNAIRPPNECPTRKAGSAPTVSTTESTCAASDHGGS